MKSNIKSWGIGAFVVAIVCLVTLSCLFGIKTNKSVSLNGNADKNFENIPEQRVVGDYVFNEYDVPTADVTVNVSGSNCATVAASWKQAIEQAQTSGKLVQINMMTNWTAAPDTTYTTSFGSDTGFFENGCIVIPQNAKIILNLSGKTINRALGVRVAHGRVFNVYGELNIIDSSLEMQTIYDMYEMYKHLEAVRVSFMFNNINAGRITGGYASGQFGSNNSLGAAIHVSGGAKLNLYSGIYSANNGQYGTVVGGEYNSTINIYDCLMYDNCSTNDASCVFSAGECNIYNGLFYSNIGRTGTIYSTTANKSVDAEGTRVVLKIYGGIFAHNSNDTSIIFSYVGGEVHLYNAVMEYNYAGQIIGVSSGGYAYVKGGLYRYNNCTQTLRNFMDKGTEKMIITGGTVADNQGIGLHGLANISVSGDFKIFNNTYNGENRNIFLRKGETLNIDGVLGDNAKLCVDFAVIMELVNLLMVILRMATQKLLHKFLSITLVNMLCKLLMVK